MEELGGGVAAHSLQVSSPAGGQNADACEQEGVVNAVESCEQGALLGVIGNTGLCGLGNDALAGVADVVDAGHDHEEDQTDGTFGQQVGHMEQNERADTQDDIADDNERTVLTELAVGLVNQEANDGVGHAVPQTHNHGEGGRQDHADAYPTHQVVGYISHQEHVQVGSGVVQGETADSPQGYTMNTVFTEVLGVNGLAHTSISLQFFLRMYLHAVSHQSSA